MTACQCLELTSVCQGGSKALGARVERRTLTAGLNYSPSHTTRFVKYTTLSGMHCTDDHLTVVERTECLRRTCNATLRAAAGTNSLPPQLWLSATCGSVCILQQRSMRSDALIRLFHSALLCFSWSIGMSLLSTPVTTPEARTRFSMDKVKKTATANIKRSQSVRLPPPTAISRSPFRPSGNGELREPIRYSRSARPFPLLHKKTLSLDAAYHATMLPHAAFDLVARLPPIPSDPVTTAGGGLVVGLAQQAEELASQVFKMENERKARCAAEDTLRLEVRNLTSEKDALRMQVASLQEVIRSSSRRMNDCVDASASALETERELRREVEARARRAEDRTLVLQSENATLTQAKVKAEKEAARRIADAKAWQEKLRTMQDSQELAVRNSRRMEELEKENCELKKAMHAFARGSTEMIVLQLELIIERLRADLTRYREQEDKMTAKGKENEFRRRDSCVLQEMRKTTQAIKRRSQESTRALHSSAVVLRGDSNSRQSIQDRPISMSILMS
ncbi:hypothetical protein DAEQUDRAFT_757705 [Daedalea quercina L-15889]|uniref:Uncharacterized protein n=1 Tax=Daedalea quercina L-15889 TaxID=1314783 RepID=A0A165PEN5_9APHY|nr:hypothetical protein DAEQUDRAFT_757705 [Daedalea quercina L-15889]